MVVVVTPRTCIGAAVCGNIPAPPEPREVSALAGGDAGESAAGTQPRDEGPGAEQIENKEPQEREALETTSQPSREAREK